jgi:trimeric autotransporter adhesin
MRTFISIFAAILLLATNVMAQSATISTYAGPPLPVTGLPAVSQGIDSPTSVVVDSAGAFYIASSSQCRVYRVANGTLTVIAGNGTCGFGGDGGPAASANLSAPSGVAIDSAGNVFVADTGNNLVRKVTPAGIISTIAGGGTGGLGDGGSATSAQLSSPFGIFVDAAGNIFIADSGDNRIREITAGVIATVAGGGTAGDGGAATSASLNNPTGVFADTAGNLFIADQLNNRIRKVSSGTITTVAGNGTTGPGTGDGGPALMARLSAPTGIAVDDFGNLFIADTGNNRIREVSTAGVITTAVGTGSSGYNGDGELPSAATLSAPTSVAVQNTNEVGLVNLYIADKINNRVREVRPAFQARGASPAAISTVAGNGTVGYGGDGGPATLAVLNFPNGVAVDAAGSLLIADTGNYRIRKVTPSGIITTFAGNGTMGFSGDGGAAPLAQLSAYSVAVDSSGNVFIADVANRRIRKVTPAGIISTVAGNGTRGFSGDGGPATAAEIGDPVAVAVDALGNLFIGDDTNYVRKVTLDGIITTVAGNGLPGYSGDGGPATAAEIYGPFGIALDPSGNLFIADSSNHRIRKVTPDGTISTVAGNGTAGFSGDGGPATAAAISGDGVAVGPAGELYLSDTTNQRIRKVTPDGTISTIAGNGIAGFSGDGGPPLAAELNYPQGICINAAGDIFVADASSSRIHRISTTPPTTGGVPGGGTSIDPLAPLPVVAPQPNPEVEQGNILSGYIIITPDANSAAATIMVTEGVVSGGVEQSQAAFLPSLLTTDATLPVDSIPSIGRNLGVAIAVPAPDPLGSSGAAVTLTLLDQRGTVTKIIGVTLGPSQQIARFVTEIFGSSAIGAGFQGSVHIQSSAPISVVGLEFTGVLFSTVPITTTVTVSGVPVRTLASGPVSNLNTPLAGATGGAAAVVTPQFAVSGGWATQLTLVNSTAAAISGRVDFFDSNGNPIAIPLNGNIQSTFTYAIPPNGTFILAPRDANGQIPLP